MQEGGWGGLRAHGPSFSLPDSLAYFVGASLLVASCLYLTARSHSYADVAYARAREGRMPKFLTFYRIISSSTDPLFGTAALRNEVDACERIDRMIGRHDTRNDCVTLYPTPRQLPPL